MRTVLIEVVIYLRCGWKRRKKTEETIIKWMDDSIKTVGRYLRMRRLEPSENIPEIVFISKDYNYVCAVLVTFSIFLGQTVWQRRLKEERICCGLRLKKRYSPLRWGTHGFQNSCSLQERLERWKGISCLLLILPKMGLIDLKWSLWFLLF